MAGVNRLIAMTVTGMQNRDALKNAYRATFEEYARKLETLQGLTGDGDRNNTQIEAVLLEVEEARVAYNCARDRLAKELVRSPLPADAGVNERHIRKTARLLWELAGRPDGTAEHDWHRAEQLVRTAASCGS